MDPLLLDVPERIATDRLVVRVPRPGDGVTDSVASSMPDAADSGPQGRSW